MAAAAPGDTPKVTVAGKGGGAAPIEAGELEVAWNVEVTYALR